jgi:hypothetical protein
MITTLFGALVVGGLTATILGDATIGATVAGVFSVLNTLIIGWDARRNRRIERGVRHTHRILTAPRQAVYDSEGHVVGTVLRLDKDKDWTGRVLPPQRAEDFDDDPPGDRRAR